MKPKDDLFRLIKSLSRSEKRYFTLDAKKSGSKSSQYLNLFQAINAMKEYDESLFPKGLTNISVGKAYLYEAILKSMRDYRSPKSKRAQLKQRIMDAKFLYERGLYHLGADRLNSAKNLANELSDSLALLEINREERRFAKARGIAIFGKLFEDYKQEKTTALVAVENEFKYLDVYDFLALEVVTNRFKYLNDDDEKEAVIEKLKPKEWIEPKSFEAKLRYLRANAFFYQLIGEDEDSGIYFRKSADIWEEYPWMKKEEFFRYIIDLANVISFAFTRGKLETVATLLNRLENEKTDNFFEKELKFQRVIIYQLLYARETKAFDQAETLENKVKAGLKIYSLKDREKLLVWIQLTLLFLEAKNPKKCRFWINKILGFKNLTIRSDIQKAARILNLLLTADEEDFDVIDLLLRSTLRFFKKSFVSEDIEFELELVDYIKSVYPFPLEPSEFENLQKITKISGSKRKNSTVAEVVQTWIDSYR